MIGVTLRDPVAVVSLRMLAPTDIAACRDRRLTQVTGTTVEREMTPMEEHISLADALRVGLTVSSVDSISHPEAEQKPGE